MSNATAITSIEEYREKLLKVIANFNAPDGSPESKELEVLLPLLQQYEDKNVFLLPAASLTHYRLTATPQMAAEIIDAAKKATFIEGDSYDIALKDEPGMVVVNLYFEPGDVWQALAEIEILLRKVNLPFQTML